MISSRTCPICTETFEEESRLTVHLEVEHRKSELVTHLIEDHARFADSVAEPEEGVDDRSAPSP